MSFSIRASKTMQEVSRLLLFFFPPQLCTSFLFFFLPPASDVKGFSTKMHARGGERRGGVNPEKWIKKVNEK